MRILGINALNHDAAISMIDDGKVVFADIQKDTVELKMILN